MITLYNAISKDGFIARVDGSEDFIPDELWDEFIDLCENYDVFVMGRKTYEAMQKYPKEEINKLEDLGVKKVVVTENTSFQVKSGYTVINSLEMIPSLGSNILVSSGPTLNSALLDEGLVDRIIKNILPENIFSGIKAYNIEPKLNLVSEEDKGKGRSLCAYQIEK